MIQKKVFNSFIVLIALTLLVTPALAAAGDTTRVSISSSGAEGNNASYSRDISADGRYVAFESDATNLVPGDTNARSDVFVHDRQTTFTERVSVSSLGVEGNGDSISASFSTDGRYIAFQSDSNNLVTGDGNGMSDVFVHDRQTGETTRVSVSSSGIEGNNDSWWPSLSADGRYVAFESYASNLVNGDANGFSDIFVHDRQTGITERISMGSEANGDSQSAFISADGRYLAFHSAANNLVSGDTNAATDIFVYDRQLGEMERVSISSLGVEGQNSSTSPAMSADGRYVVFQSLADNLVAGDTNTNSDVFIHDRQTGQTTRASVSSSGSQGNAWSSYVSISADGNYVAFQSSSSNLVAGDMNLTPDVFVYNRQTGVTECASVDSYQVEPLGNSPSFSPYLSADGRYVAFESRASNLVSGDTNGAYDVFVHERDVPPATVYSLYIPLALK